MSVPRFFRLLGTAFARTPIRLALFLALALAASFRLLDRASSMSMYRDAQILFQYEEVARRTVLDFGQFPLWNPYYCGGIDGLGTPQSRFISPTFLLSLLFGTAQGEALAAFAMMALGLEGTFRYVKERGAGTLGAVLAAPLFALSGMFAMSPALGWTNFFGFELIPWVLVGIRGALRKDARGVAIAALFFAWMVGFGGTYSAPLALLYVAFEIVEFVIRREPVRQKLDPLVYVFAALAFAGILAAIRMLPVAETVAHAPRIIGGTPGTGPKSILRALVGRIQPDGGGDFPISGNFLIGWAAAPALLFGLTARRARPPFVVAFLFLWLAAGFAAKVSIFRILRELPLYSSLRSPERFLSLFAIAVAVLAALGVSRALAFARKKPQVGVPLVVVAIVALASGVGPLVKNHWVAAEGRPMAAVPERFVQPFKQARGNRWLAGHYPFFDRGSLSCFDAYPVPQSTLLRGDLAQEEYAAAGSRATVERKKWSPNEIDLHVHAEEETRVYINQNWHSGWRTNIGSIENKEGLLSIVVPPGDHELVLRFRPRAFLAGGIISLLGLVALLVFVRRPPRTGRSLALRTALLVLTPLAIGSATYFGIHEAKPAPIDALTPEGSPIAVDTLPNGVTPMDVRFESGMSLVGANIAPKVVPAGGKVVIEFDWKTEPNVEGRLGVFVHLVPNDGERIQPDHVLLSGVLEIERAPAGKILRDVMEVDMADETRGKTWQVFVGLWRVRRDGTRVHLVDAHGAKTDDHSVYVGEYTVQ